MNLTEIGTAVGLFVLLAGIVVAAYAYLKTKLVETTGQLWKAEAEALKERLQTVEADNQSCKAQIAALERENEILKDTVTGASLITEHDKNVRALHAEVMAAIWGLASMSRSNN